MCSFIYACLKLILESFPTGGLCGLTGDGLNLLLCIHNMKEIVLYLNHKNPGYIKYDCYDKFFIRFSIDMVQ